MEPRVIQVVGIRGLRGTPGVAPELAIGEAQVAAFFQQDGPVVNVTLSPAGVCWVEFADAGSAARAALRDGENSSGHSLRVTLLHPQPSQQPASLRAPAEWYPQQVDVTGAHLASDLASLRVGSGVSGLYALGQQAAPFSGTSLASSRSSSGTALVGVGGAPGSSGALNPWATALTGHNNAGSFAAGVGQLHGPPSGSGRAYSPSSMASSAPGDDTLSLGGTGSGLLGAAAGGLFMPPPPGYGSPVYGSTPPHGDTVAAMMRRQQQPPPGLGPGGVRMLHSEAPVSGGGAGMLAPLGGGFPSLASHDVGVLDGMAASHTGGGAGAGLGAPSAASTISYAAAAAKARSAQQQHSGGGGAAAGAGASPFLAVSRGAPPRGEAAAGPASPAGIGGGATPPLGQTNSGGRPPTSRPSPQAVAVAAASPLPLAAAISTVHGVPAPVASPPAARREVQHTCVLKMRGLPFSARKADIVAFFAPGMYPGAPAQPLKEESIHIVLEVSGRPAGIAFCEFASPDEARAACQNRHKKSMGARYVELFASSREEATRVATGMGKW